MAKKQQVKKVRREIPYKDRQSLTRQKEILENRDDAARVAMMLACVALNDTEKLGKQRLIRFAKRHQQLIEEFYGDRERQSIHLARRLEALGFAVEDGRMLALIPTEEEEARE